MRLTLIAAATVAALTLPGAAAAGPIQNACLASERSRGNATLCRCIQGAADATLTNADQRRAARFFRDPHKAQEVRASTTSANNAFWDRYVAFGQRAEAQCG